jgi:sigma-B regulation protein RsbU (phosphoserine phosphatase)
LNDQHGLPLGLYPEKEYLDSTIQIKKGESLILYTDGITDHINEAGEYFGNAQLLHLLRQIREKNPEILLKRIIDTVDQFGHGVSQDDDLSLMVVNYA